MPTVHRISRSIALKSISTFATLVGGFATSVIVSRALGKDRYGLLVLVFTVSGLAYSLSDFGAKRTLNRYLPPTLSGGFDDLTARPLVSILLLVQLAGASLWGLGVYALARPLAVGVFQKPELESVLGIGAAYVFWFCLYDYVVQWFQSLQDWVGEAIVSVTFIVLQLVLLLAAASRNALTPGSALLLNTIAMIAAVAAGVVWLPRQVLRDISWRFQRVEWATYGRLVTHFGLPLTLGTLNFYILGWADKAILGRYQPAGAVAVYYVAWLFLSGAMTLFKVLQLVLQPYVSEISVKPEAVIRHTFELTVRWFTHAAVVCAFAMYFLIVPLVLRGFGGGYTEVVPVFRVLIPVFIVRGIYNGIGMFVANAYSLVRETFWLGIFLMAVNVAFNLVLIPRHGAFGAAAAGLLSYLVFDAVAFTVMPQIRRMLPVASLGRTGVAAAGTALALWPLDRAGLHPIVLAVAGPAMYVVALAVVREIEAPDVRLLVEAVSALGRTRRAEAATEILGES